MLNIKLKYNYFFVYLSGKYTICPVTLHNNIHSMSMSEDFSNLISKLTTIISPVISTITHMYYTSISKTNVFDFLMLKRIFLNAWLGINVGFIGVLYLNGLGFKSTRKKTNDKKYWRFNVGHSHVFKYYTPKDLIMKVKTRLLFFFGLNKVQIGDILHKLRSFHIPDVYKGVGLKFKDEIIRLKKGKTRQ